MGLKLLSFSRSRWVVLYKLDLLRHFSAEVKRAESVARVQQKFLLAKLDGTCKLIVAIQEVPGESVKVLGRPWVN